jgi:hypothetical protein
VTPNGTTTKAVAFTFFDEKAASAR